MTIYNIWHDKRRHTSDFTGLDTDVKPVNSRGLVPYVSRFFETEVATDCTTEYLWTGTGWVIQGFTPAEIQILKARAAQQGFTPTEIEILKVVAAEQ